MFTADKAAADAALSARHLCYPPGALPGEIP